MECKINYLRALITAALLLIPVAAFGQTRPTWETALEIQSGVRGAMIGTITSLDTARSRFVINADGDSAGTPVRVNADSVTSKYYGFGSGSAVYSGSNGFSQLRVGDRIQVSGIGRPNQIIETNEVLLLGRSTGKIPSMATPGTALPANTVEGIVRSMNASDYRLVIETDQRELLNVYGAAGTPVYFRGEVFRISNVEVGDRIRVQYESRTSDGVRPRIIDVVQDATPETTGDGRTMTSLVGRVTRIDSRTQTLRMDAGRGTEVRVDLAAARDSNGKTFRVTDLQVGDRIELTGRYTSSDVFRAETVRFATDGGRWEPADVPGGTGDAPAGLATYETVVIYGSVRTPLGTGAVLTIRDTSAKRDYDIHLVDDFAVRLKTGSYITAEQLKAGDQIVVQAFRDRDSQLIAQTVRMR